MNCPRCLKNLEEHEKESVLFDFVDQQGIFIVFCESCIKELKIQVSEWRELQNTREKNDLEKKNKD